MQILKQPLKISGNYFDKLFDGKKPPPKLKSLKFKELNSLIRKFSSADIKT